MLEETLHDKVSSVLKTAATRKEESEDEEVEEEEENEDEIITDSKVRPQLILWTFKYNDYKYR